MKKFLLACIYLNLLSFVINYLCALVGPWPVAAGFIAFGNIVVVGFLSWHLRND